MSITPPEAGSYSIDKYFDRDDIPVEFDDLLYEVRLLTVMATHRAHRLGPLMMYAAYRWIAARGGDRIVAIGRTDLLDLYRRSGLQLQKQRTRAGEVEYQLMTAQMQDLNRLIGRSGTVLARLLRGVSWHVEEAAPQKPEPTACFHGGSFFEAIGERFEHLDRAGVVINADVLDAWFDASPRVLATLTDNLAWSLKTSPPTDCHGMQSAIAEARCLPEESILPAAGSSDLIFLALRHWLDTDSRVLILDPMYGEYRWILKQVIGCQIGTVRLSREKQYDLDPRELRRRVAEGFDWVILVNPNSPTGRHLGRSHLEKLARDNPSTRFWIDETYVDYLGNPESLERYAAGSPNMVVCKSMSKVYALSGVRCAYLCAHETQLRELRPLTPPWAVSLPGQLAAVNALQDVAYYQGRWNQTHGLRRELAAGLESLGFDVIPGTANFLLCHIPADGPTTQELIESCRHHGLYLRDVSSMGETLSDPSFRITVKDRGTNARMLKILAAVGTTAPTGA